MNFICALDFIFPLKCGVCGKIGTPICKDCEKKIEQYKINLLEENYVRNKEISIKINKFYIYKYSGIIRELLIKYKFYDSSYLADTFAKLMLKNEKLFGFLKNYDIIIPVPLHKKRKLQRGYNQVELIARKLGKIKMEDTSLVKVKNIKPQSQKRLNERITDIEGVYKVTNIKKIENKKILLFDDIYTTGSTVGECIKVLSKYSKEIGVLIIAKDYMEVKNG